MHIIFALHTTCAPKLNRPHQISFIYSKPLNSQDIGTQRFIFPSFQELYRGYIFTSEHFIMDIYRNKGKNM